MHWVFIFFTSNKKQINQDLYISGTSAAAAWRAEWCERSGSSICWSRQRRPERNTSCCISSDRRSCHSHEQKKAKIDSLRFRTANKQLSGLHWQNEYRRRPSARARGQVNGTTANQEMKERDWVVLTNLSSRVWRSYMPVQSARFFTLENKPHGHERLKLRKSKQPSQSCCFRNQPSSVMWRKSKTERTLWWWILSFYMIMTGLKRQPEVNSNSQMCLNFSFSCTIAHILSQTYAGSSRRLVSCKHDWKHWLCSKCWLDKEWAELLQTFTTENRYSNHD